MKWLFTLAMFYGQKKMDRPDHTIEAMRDSKPRRNIAEMNYFIK